MIYSEYPILDGMVTPKYEYGDHRYSITLYSQETVSVSVTDVSKSLSPSLAGNRRLISKMGKFL